MNIFKKILIANRGEIAVRVIRSAKELGIRTVAVYSVPDEESLHVDLADEAWCIGGADLGETYLNIPKIIGIALKSGCEAIHPGYGFLAENPAFVKACEDAGMVFIGPDSRAIRLMGNKIESREYVKKIGIPMTEGITGDKEALLRDAESIPLPLLVKAAAGGGGKGMRIVNDLKELPSILESTEREAKSYFGDGTVYIEKYIEEPRHIEIQVIADHHGNTVHLFERECSIQRRHQKIIEESPSVTLTPEIRKKMGDAAVRIASGIGYRNAGTVEFLVDKDLNFFFLEMNTRVQVEHPVTEMVTGTDIVREQILISAGNPLSFTQTDLTQTGHAIECRIYAEDPSNNFLPSPGIMTMYAEPQGDGVRIDTGIAEATTIHSFYDPMISKLIVWGHNREMAREKMIRALHDYPVHGIKTNIPYLAGLLHQKAYIENKISTSFCDEHTGEIIRMNEQEKSQIPLYFPVIAFLMYSVYEYFLENPGHYGDIWKLTGYWRDFMKVPVVCDGRDIDVRIFKEKDGIFEFGLQGQTISAELKSIDFNRAELLMDERLCRFFISGDKKGNAYVSYDGHIFNLARRDILVEEDVFGSLDAGSKHQGEIVSPMPGKIIKIAVSEGQKVNRGDLLLIVEAMKMENNILAPVNGVVEAIHVKPGDRVDGSKELLILRPTDE
ncbi:MAG: acetyl-CoA carboxylase biotin carboxylase subunit [Bacteroidales bacterium]|nr:acetyl-CoA carboxylase biotin carboxylase subunit [Bacteroidales bacterium]